MPHSPTRAPERFRRSRGGAQNAGGPVQPADLRGSAMPHSGPSGKWHSPAGAVQRPATGPGRAGDARTTRAPAPGRLADEQGTPGGGRAAGPGGRTRGRYEGHEAGPDERERQTSRRPDAGTYPRGKARPPFHGPGGRGPVPITRARNPRTRERPPARHEGRTRGRNPLCESITRQQWPNNGPGVR